MSYANMALNVACFPPQTHKKQHRQTLLCLSFSNPLFRFLIFEFAGVFFIPCDTPFLLVPLNFEGITDRDKNQNVPDLFPWRQIKYDEQNKQTNE